MNDLRLSLFAALFLGMWIQTASVLLAQGDDENPFRDIKNYLGVPRSPGYTAYRPDPAVPPGVEPKTAKEIREDALAIVSETNPAKVSDDIREALIDDQFAENGDGTANIYPNLKFDIRGVVVNREPLKQRYVRHIILKEQLDAYFNRQDELSGRLENIRAQLNEVPGDVAAINEQADQLAILTALGAMRAELSLIKTQSKFLLSDLETQSAVNNDRERVEQLNQYDANATLMRADAASSGNLFNAVNQKGKAAKGNFVRSDQIKPTPAP